jgi:hypothetical protein
MQKLNHIRNVPGLLFHTLVFIACDVNYRLKLSFMMVNAVFTVRQAEIGKGAYCFVYLCVNYCTSVSCQLYRSHF